MVIIIFQLKLISSIYATFQTSIKLLFKSATEPKDSCFLFYQEALNSNQIGFSLNLDIVMRVTKWYKNLQHLLEVTTTAMGVGGKRQFQALSVKM